MHHVFDAGAVCEPEHVPELVRRRRRADGTDDGIDDRAGVYDYMSAMTPGGLRHAYGAGIRVIRNRMVLLRLELAGGAEGPHLLVSFSSSF